MKHLLIASILLTLSTNSIADGIGEYSTGIRLGQITKFGVKGIMIKSGEGQMLMGRESTPYILPKDGNTPAKIINPWSFSVPMKNKGIISSLKESQGEYVVLKYKQSHIKLPNVDTDYEVTEVINLKEKVTEPCKTKNYIKGNKSQSTRIGRLVKMSSKGTFINSFEVMIQQGNSGNQFKNLSITDPEMYKCSQKFLMSGQKVKITYSQSLFNTEIFSRSTSYDIVKIAPISTNSLD